MKTVSTKLDNKLHNRFIEICNEDGKCQSEFLRDLIETLCEDLEEEKVTSQDQEIEDIEPKSVTIEPAVMSHGKILDDYGNVIGTF